MAETLAQKQARLKGIAIAAAEAVYHYRLIARSVNVDQDTLKNWRDADSEFSDELEQGRYRFLKKNIKLSKPEFLLERLDPETFKQRSESDLTSGGNPITPILVKFVGEDDATNDRNTKGV